MFYKKYTPAKALSQLVECYYVWEGYPSSTMNIESPPPALCSMVFNYKKPYQLSNSKYKQTSVPKFFISGQSLKNYTLHISGEIGVVGVVLRPPGLYHFLNIPMFSFTDERVAFDQIFPNQHNQFVQELQQASSHEEKVSGMKNFIHHLQANHAYSTPEIMYASNEIYDTKGQCNIPELIKSVFMSRRTFERKFLEEVGISPKAYAKIRRFGYTCSLMAGNRDVDFMEVLHRGGYYDQSHFIKDFKYFAGRTPGIYAQTNVELANYVDSISVIESKLIKQN